MSSSFEQYLDQNSGCKTYMRTAPSLGFTF